MSAENDIVERLEGQAASRIHSPVHRSLFREAAAALAERDTEIVRLRGEVCSCPSGDGSLRWPCKAHPPESIAPAEAKGDDPGEFGVGIQPNPKARYWQERADFWRGQAIAHGYRPEGEDTPQPADGGAVAFVNTGDSEAQFIADGERLNCPACGGSGHVDDTHPTGDALGAVRELVHKWRTRIPCDTQDTPRILMREWCADELEAALRAADNRDAAGVGESPCKGCGNPVFAWADDSDVRCLDCTPAAVPAGEAVAPPDEVVWCVVDRNGRIAICDDEADALECHSNYEELWPARAPFRIATIIPPPAPVQAAPQEGEDEPEDVREIISRDKRVWALAGLAEKCGAVKDEGECGLFWTLTLSDFYKLESALQHRGDSRGGEG